MAIAKKRALAAFAATLGAGAISYPASFAQVSFQQAVNDYGQGHYAQALSELETYKSAYPSNVQVHYYIALCQQCLNHLGEARAEYQWVSDHGDARFKGLAASGLGQLHGVSAPGSSGGARSSTSASAGSSSAMGKVRKIYEFWAAY